MLKARGNPSTRTCLFSTRRVQFECVRLLKNLPQRLLQIAKRLPISRRGLRLAGHVANKDLHHLLRIFPRERAVNFGVLLARVTDQHEAPVWELPEQLFDYGWL